MINNSSFKASGASRLKRKLDNSELESCEKGPKIQCLSNSTFFLPNSALTPSCLDSSQTAISSCLPMPISIENDTTVVLPDNETNANLPRTSRKRSREIEDMDVECELNHSEPKIARTSPPNLDKIILPIKPVEESIAEAIHTIHACDANIQSSVHNALLLYVKKKKQMEGTSLGPQPQLATFSFSQAEEFITEMMSDLDNWLQGQYMNCLLAQSNDQYLNFLNFNNDNLLRQRQDQHLDLSRLSLGEDCDSDEMSEQLDYMG